MGEPFKPDVLQALAVQRASDPPEYQRALADLKKAGVPLRDLKKELSRPHLRLVGGGKRDDEENIERVGPYSVQGGVIVYTKKTYDGSVDIPLCNFTARVVREEVRGTGARQG